MTFEALSKGLCANNACRRSGMDSDTQLWADIEVSTDLGDERVSVGLGREAGQDLPHL